MNTPAQPILVSPDNAEKLAAFGDVISVFLGGEKMKGEMTVMVDVTPPGGGPPLHVHANEDELFLPLEGKIEFWVEGRWTEVPPGGVVFLPRGVPHRFRNVGDTPCRQWIITTPSGFETFFSRCADEFAKPTGPDMEQIVNIGQEHGITFLKDPEAH